MCGGMGVCVTPVKFNMHILLFLSRNVCSKIRELTVVVLHFQMLPYNFFRSGAAGRTLILLLCLCNSLQLIHGKNFHRK